MSVTTSQSHQGDPVRFQLFAKHFQSYMGLSSLLMAALPIPVSAFDLVPLYASLSKPTSVFTSMFCFLLLGFVFYNRRWLAPKMFPEYFENKIKELNPDNIELKYLPENIRMKLHDFDKDMMSHRISGIVINLAPLFLILVSIFSSIFYLYILNKSVGYVMDSQNSCGGDHPIQIFDCVLQSMDAPHIPFGHVIVGLYFVVFVSAEVAFILMATKEYVQDSLNLSDRELIDMPWHAGLAKRREAPGQNQSSRRRRGRPDAQSAETDAGDHSQPT
jgi:hypothetical protein